MKQPIRIGKERKEKLKNLKFRQVGLQPSLGHI